MAYVSINVLYKFNYYFIISSIPKQCVSMCGFWFVKYKTDEIFLYLENFFLLA